MSKKVGITVLIVVILVIMYAACQAGVCSNTNNIVGKNIAGEYEGSGFSSVGGEFVEEKIEFKNDDSFVLKARLPYLSSEWSVILGTYKVEGKNILLTLRSGEVLTFTIENKSTIISNVGIKMIKQ